MANAKNAVKEIYLNVVNDVIEGVREAFLDDGMDDMVLQELKQLWESKLALCKAVDRAHPPPVEPSVVPSQNRASQNAGATAQPAAATQLVPPGITSLQPNAAVLQPQLMRLHSSHQTAGPAFGTVTQLTAPAQIAANSLPAAFFRQLINFAPGQKQILLPGLHPATLTPMATVAASDVGSVVNSKPIVQLDGMGDSSSEEDEDHEDDDDNDDDEDDDQNDDADDGNVEEEDPLNSGDDVSDADPTEVFDAENVVVCQFEKINRCKNRWKFHLKDGIMNLNGRDYLFQKANGDAEW